MLRHYFKLPKLRQESFNDSTERDLAIQKLKNLYDSKGRKSSTLSELGDDSETIES